MQTFVTYFNVSLSSARIALIAFNTDANVVFKRNLVQKSTEEWLLVLLLSHSTLTQTWFLKGTLCRSQQKSGARIALIAFNTDANVVLKRNLVQKSTEELAVHSVATA